MSLDSCPARKRQRLSSPTYDDLVNDLSQEDLRAVEEIEAKYSQSTQSSSGPLLGLPSSLPKNVQTTHDSAYKDTSTVPESSFPKFRSPSKVGVSHDNPDNLQEQPRSMFTSAAALASPQKLFTGFASAKHLPLASVDNYDRSPSPDAPPDPDYDAWFNSTSIPIVTGFQTAKAVTTGVDIADIGFKTAGQKGLLALSADALEKASKRMRSWEEQAEEELIVSQEPASPSLKDDAIDPFMSTTTPHRPTLRAVENSFAFPGPSTPSPTGAHFSTPLVAKSTPGTLSGFDIKGNKAFKPPSVVRPNIRQAPRVAPHTPAPKPPHPLSSVHMPSPALYPTIPARPPTQLPRLGLTPVKGSGLVPTVKRFATPFKAGMRPGEPGRTQLQKELEKTRLEKLESPAPSRFLQTQSLARSGKETERVAYFDLSSNSNRRSLASLGLVPQSYTVEHLESMGINVSELAQITPDLALYYCFNSRPLASVDPASTPVVSLGPAEALDELQHIGCSLATKPWVDNHWGLILWKLAGLVCLEPGREGDPAERRWCWAEVLKQFRYRYERELNGGVRPPLRLIVSRDSPASSPMVLCVSKITWTEGVTDDGTPIVPFPELEVTDGWYRLRAQVDEALARAIRRKVIRVGRKIAVVDARLSSSRKEASDILEAHDSVFLKLAGNSSCLAPWHAKLGFQRNSPISTLHSLTPDGGNIAIMNLVINKVYPVAYLEFVEGEDGKKHRQGPHNEKDENAVRERWKAKREAEESKLRFAMEKRLTRLESFADRMEQKAGSKFHPNEDDSVSDRVEEICDQLENASTSEASSIMGSLNHQEAGWLARLIRDKVTKEREASREEFESELNCICPPREVRDFRVIIARDVRTHRRPANRFAQITVWNVLNLVFHEGGKPGGFEEDKAVLKGHKFDSHSTEGVDGIGQWFRDIPQHQEGFKMDKDALNLYAHPSLGVRYYK